MTRIQATLVFFFEIALPMAEFDYNASAELFPTRKRVPGVSRSDTSVLPMPPKPSASPSKTFRPELLAGAFLEVDEQRYNSDEIRRLYESAKYPLARRSARP